VSSKRRNGTSKVTQESRSGEIISSSTAGPNCRSVSLGHPNRTRQSHRWLDMWWLALCLIVMCLIERSKLENVANVIWFNTFSLSECRFIALYGNLGTCRLFLVKCLRRCLRMGPSD